MSTATARSLRLVAATAAVQSLALVATVGATRGLRASVALLAGEAPAADPARTTAALSAIAWTGLLLCALWFAAAVAACARDLARHPSRPLPRTARGCLRPAFVRSVLVVLVSGTLVSPRPAPVADHDPGWEVLDGLPLPGLPRGEAPATRDRAQGRDTRSHTRPGPRPATVRVDPGDCLWSITADLLGPAATDADVARAWPRLHRANRAHPATVGADPDLLHVGAVLRVPASLTTARPGAAR